MLSISAENFAAIRILVSRIPHSSYFLSTTLSSTPTTSNSSFTSLGYFHSVLERSFSARSTSLTPRGRTSPHRCLSSRVTLESRVRFSFLLRPKVRIHSCRDRNLLLGNTLPSESNMIYIQELAFGESPEPNEQMQLTAKSSKEEGNLAARSMRSESSPDSSLPKIIFSCVVRILKEVKSTKSICAQVLKYWESMIERCNSVSVVFNGPIASQICWDDQGVVSDPIPITHTSDFKKGWFLSRYLAYRPMGNGARQNSRIVSLDGGYSLSTGSSMLCETMK
jgi:hypothetical protein